MLVSKYTCIRCTRQLTRLTRLSQLPSTIGIQQATIPSSTTYSRLSAARSLHSSVSRLHRDVVPEIATRNSFAKVRFTRADVPPWEFWHLQARPPLVADLSADECLQTAQAYVEAALKDSPGWRQRLITTNDTSFQPHDGKSRIKILSANTLHYVALIIIVNKIRPAHLGTHIFHTLATLDYAPSILTFARIALKRKLHGRPQFEPIIEGLERVLKHIGDGEGSKSVSRDNNNRFAADACTLRALIYAAEDTHEGDNNALRWFRRAYEIGASAKSGASATSSTRDQVPQKQIQEKESDISSGSEGLGERFNPHWQWEVSFALGVAAIRLKRGEIEKANDMYMFAANELDNPGGYYGMAEILEKMGKTGTDEYVEYLEKAAIGGNRDAARKLGSREWDRAIEGGLSKWEKRKRQVFAEEWMAVAAPRKT
ncbi:hypothetical protein F5Y19DRAFT_450736 [Xylariaceae sp. FL1651]|nr:hypothetical protein F5Y19DRAFT_450736 [Xylariaceae sp. FL1651]